jgi:hypothetical protein
MKPQIESEEFPIIPEIVLLKCNRKFMETQRISGKKQF